MSDCALHCNIESFAGVPCGLDVVYGSANFVLDRRSAEKLRAEIDRFLAAISEAGREFHDTEVNHVGAIEGARPRNCVHAAER